MKIYSASKIKNKCIKHGKGPDCILSKKLNEVESPISDDIIHAIFSDENKDNNITDLMNK